MEVFFVAFLLPFGICVILPVAIVCIVFYSINCKNNIKARILIEAIKSGEGIDITDLAKAFTNGQRSLIQDLNRKLLRGGIFSLFGLTFVVLSIMEACHRQAALIDTAVGETTDWQTLYFYVFLAGICLSVGIGFLLVYFVSRNRMKEEIREEKVS